MAVFLPVSTPMAMLGQVPDLRIVMGIFSPRVLCSIGLYIQLLALTVRLGRNLPRTCVERTSVAIILIVVSIPWFTPPRSSWCRKFCMSIAWTLQFVVGIRWALTCFPVFINRNWVLGHPLPSTLVTVSVGPTRLVALLLATSTCTAIVLLFSGEWPHSPYVGSLRHG